MYYGETKVKPNLTVCRVTPVGFVFETTATLDSIGEDAVSPQALQLQLLGNQYLSRFFCNSRKSASSSRFILDLGQER
eukprot:gene12995-9294_t